MEAHGWNETWASRFGDGSGLPGRIVRMDRESAVVVIPSGAERVSVRLETPNGPPVVGDWVRLAETDGGLVLVEILPRNGEVQRRDPGQDVVQTLVSNVDVGVVTQGMDRPYVPERLERYLVLVETANARAVIALTKSDLVSDPTEMADNVARDLPGFSVITIGLKDDVGLQELQSHWEPSETIALLGESGAGKSTLVNRLTDVQSQEVGATRERDAKGRHTTVARELILLSDGGLIIDTPGLRSVGLWTSRDDLDQVFSDILEWSADCRFNDCSHIHEPGCEVQRMLTNGELSQRRYDSFVKLRSEIDDLESRLEQNRRRRGER